MARRTPTPPPMTVLDKVESAALQAINERDELRHGLDSLKMEMASAIQSYNKAIEETEEKLRKTTLLADGLNALFETEGVR